MALRVEELKSNPKHFWLRGQRPDQLVRPDEETGIWHVYGYPEAVAVLGNPEVYSSATARRYAPEDGAEFAEDNLLQLDPPEHRNLRTLASHAFTPRVVAELAPRIERIFRDLLDGLAGRDQFDFVTELAYPLPITVISELLGVPAADRRLFKQWVDEMMDANGAFDLSDDPEKQARDAKAQLEPARQLTEYLHAHAADRRARPRDDLLTRFVQAEVDGDRLTDRQVAKVAHVLLIAGHTTTAMLLANSMLCFDSFPDQQARVRADRSLVSAAFEEVHRFLTPVAATYRATAVAAELGGQRIPAERMVVVWSAAANRDPRQFAQPDVFDAGRDPNPHVGFGRGIHFCLGAALARLEGRIALNLLFDRYPALCVDRDAEPSFLPAQDLISFWNLPVRAE
ncbi:cytochrome P450 [Amycolatopsis sp. VS8301801F10]|uniref:cytochrome P450 n=1 Tax=Amycolatopsis sp. VS8301801F10 TaxID=2652442 RepID=UPI0038FC8CA4